MLGYRVLAEGVEDVEIFDHLAGAGCDAMQGYFLSRPLEADAVLKFMRSQVNPGMGFRASRDEQGR